MDGVAVLVHLLHNDTDVEDLVPNDRVQAGVLPQGVALPAISVTSVSKVDRNLMSAGVYRHVTERVQVSVLASTYPQAKTIIRAVREAAADTFPAIAGLINVTVHTDSAGPDMMNDAASLYMQSQDFRVTYSEERQPAAS